MNKPDREFRVLIYGSSFAPAIGGAERLVNLLATGLADLNSKQQPNGEGRRIAVTLVTRTAANGTDDSAFPYKIIRRPSPGKLLDLIRNADVVHIAGPCLLPLAIAFLMRRRVIVEHHGYQAICPNGLLFQQPTQTACPGHFQQHHYGACVRCVSTTIGLASAVRSLLLTFPRQWLCKKVEANITVTNHVAVRLQLPRSRTIYHGIANSGAGNAFCASLCRTIAYVGRFVPEKGLTVLLHAARNLRDRGIPFHLKLIGDGSEQKSLKECCKALGLEDVIDFTGVLRGSDLERALSDVGILVMPSLWEETAGFSAIEQMMRGRIVVAADIGGLAEVVGDAGLKFTPGDAQGLASCVQQLIENEALAKRLASAARDRATSLFNRDQMILSHVNVYEAV